MLGLIRLGLAFAFILSLNQAARSQSDQPRGPSGGSTQGGVPVDLDWKELSGTARERALELLAAQTGSNYQKISTWTGTYSLHSEQYWPKSSMKLAFEGEGKPAQAAFHESDHLLRFAIDVQSDSFFQ